MKIAVMGAGGIGALYGGRMAQAGEEVIFIARGPHLAALREKGLRVESETLGDFVLPQVAATDDPAEIGPVDLVWMTVKAYDLEQAARQILPLVGADTAVIPLLNGVEIAERMGTVVGMAHMLGGAVQVSAAIVEPGLIRHAALDRLMFGELQGGASPRAEAIQTMMTGAGIPSVLSTDIQKEIWLKFLRLNTFAGMAALTRMPLGRILADPDVRAMALECMRETEAIARKKGVELEAGVSEAMIAEAGEKFAAMKPSMLLDLERGRKLELEIFQGTTVRLGKELGIPTPVNSFIHTALIPHAEGSAPAQ